MRRMFRRFVRRYLQKHVRPIDDGEELKAAEWIESTKYPEHRKDQLRKLLSTLDFSGDPMSVRNTRVKCFVKDECYRSFKHTRSIFARVDEFKLRVAPFFARLEHELYQQPEFVKHIPVVDRAAYVAEHLGSALGCVYVATDYTAFESHFTTSLLEDCEFQLYRHFAGTNGPANECVRLYTRVVSGINRCEYRNVKAFIKAKRMSGEMSTSVGNGFTNLMVVKFLAEWFGFSDTKCVVEGDDCLVAFPRDKLYAKPHADLLAKHNRISKVCMEYNTTLDMLRVGYVMLGLTVKLDVHEHLHTAGFCSMVFGPEERIVIPDPVKKIANFGWISGKYQSASLPCLRSLLRGKSLSLLSESRGVPILQEMAIAMVRLTVGFQARYDHENWFKRDRIEHLEHAQMISKQNNIVSMLLWDRE